MNQASCTFSSNAKQALAVWYDGACPLCLREIALMRRWDTNSLITFVDLTDPAQACPVDRHVVLARLHARENGIMLDGAAAFAAMWRAVPRLCWLGELARNRAMLWGLEQIYCGFLRLRPALQALMR